MNSRFIILLAGGACAWIVWRACQPATTTIGTKKVALPTRIHDPSGAWKGDTPTFSNLWGKEPYGYSGFPANAYLPKMEDQDGFTGGVLNVDADPAQAAPLYTTGTRELGIMPLPNTFDDATPQYN